MCPLLHHLNLLSVNLMINKRKHANVCVRVVREEKVTKNVSERLTTCIYMTITILVSIESECERVNLHENLRSNKGHVSSHRLEG